MWIIIAHLVVEIAWKGTGFLSTQMLQVSKERNDLCLQPNNMVISTDGEMFLWE